MNDPSAGGVTGATERRRTAMPNWCHNSLTITGSVDEIARFKQTCLRRVAHEDGPALDFEAIKPMPGIFDDDPGETWFPDPDALKNRERVETQKAFEAQALEATGSAHARDWACEHWGTRGNACFFHACRDEPGRRGFGQRDSVLTDGPCSHEATTQRPPRLRKLRS